MLKIYLINPKNSTGNALVNGFWGRALDTDFATNFAAGVSYLRLLVAATIFIRPL